MEFKNLLDIVENEPVFETGLLLSGNVDALDVRKQLSRWTTAKKITQLRRGLYCLASPYQKIIPHPFLVANRLQAASYVSLQSALAYYGLIPESVQLTTSVTTLRPIIYQTPLGDYAYQHIQVNWFHGYRWVSVGGDQWAFIATPEKALLDLVYLQPGGDTAGYLRSLRLQALDQLNMDQMQKLAEQAGKPKLLRAVQVISQLREEEGLEYKPL
jgi:predicted transcriptional regulator of viral defense system